MPLEWRPLALDDRDQIMDYIALDNPHAALELDEEYQRQADRLLENPKLGKPGRMKGTRAFVVHRNYVLVYTIEGNTIIILRVLHAAQQWPKA
jgi:addiction module RelE/StbE family toxin